MCSLTSKTQLQNQMDSHVGQLMKYLKQFVDVFMLSNN